jgi:5'-nucleotidase / UDP-sugar diphosphatase
MQTSFLRHALAVCLSAAFAFGGTSLSFATGDGGAEPLLFTILHTNDEHSSLLPSPLADFHPVHSNPARGGFARLAQAVEDLRARKTAEAEPVLALSAGDYLGGSAFAWLMLQDEAPEVSLLLDIGYDVITIGNHEYDYDSERLARYLAAAGYPAAAARTAIVATNTIIPHDHALARVGIEPTHLRTLDNGLAVGFFGLLGRHAAGLVPLAPPVTFADPLDTARQAVANLRAAGADVVVAITHAGTREDIVLAEQVPGIDVIVGGHSHEALYEPLMHAGTIIVQAGSRLHYLGVLELEFDRARGTVNVRNGKTAQANLLPLDDNVDLHPAIASRIADYERKLNTTIARLTGDRITDHSAVIAAADFSVAYRAMQESPMGNFVTDAMRARAADALNTQVDFAFQANGVIRSAIIPGTMPYSLGHITFADIVECVGLGFGPDRQPGYPMISVYLTGEEVRRILEVSMLLSQLRGNSFFLQVSGLQAMYDPARAILARVPFSGTPIPTTRAVLSARRAEGDQYVPLPRGDDALYHVVTDYYLAAFLPLVARVMPRLGLELKDQNGNAVAPEDTIIYRDGQELKVWQAVVEYAAAQPIGSHGLPQIPDRYRDVEGRLVQYAAVPLLTYPLTGIAGFVLLGGWVAIRRRTRRRTRS